MPTSTIDVQELSKELRLLPEHEAYARIIDLSRTDELLASQVAPRALHTKSLQHALLRAVLGHVNAHSAQWWLDALVPRLGIRQVLGVLASELPNSVEAVRKALYFLPPFVGSDQRAQQLFQRLLEATNTRQLGEDRVPCAPRKEAGKHGGKRNASHNLGSLEKELELLRQRQQELRLQIRERKTEARSLKKLEERLARELSEAKFTVSLIKQKQPDWNEMEFYRKISPREPTSGQQQGRRSTLPRKVCR